MLRTWHREFGDHSSDTHLRWVYRPFARPSEGTIAYHPQLPKDSIVRTLGLRPLRAWIRPWVMPDSVEKASGLWVPKAHSRHPRVWAWILAVCKEDIDRYGLVFDAIYHYKRFSEEDVYDEDPAVNVGNQIIGQSLPVSLIRLDQMTFSVEPSPIPLQIAPDDSSNAHAAALADVRRAVVGC